MRHRSERSSCRQHVRVGGKTRLPPKRRRYKHVAACERANVIARCEDSHERPPRPGYNARMDTPWYQTYFGADYLSIYRLADTEDQLALLRRVLAPLAGGLIYDLPCGHGRHTGPLTRDGYRIVGLDLSETFLRVAQDRARTEGWPARLARADLRDLPLVHGRADAVICMFTSLGYFDDDREHAAVVVEFARLVRPGGRLVLDLANIDAVRMQPPTSSWTKDGVEVHSTYCFDESTKRAHTAREVRFPDGRQEHYESSVRLFEADELRGLFAIAGWHLDDQLGTYAGDPVTPHTPRRISLCTRS